MPCGPDHLRPQGHSAPLSRPPAPKSPVLRRPVSTRPVCRSSTPSQYRSRCRELTSASVKFGPGCGSGNSVIGFLAGLTNPASMSSCRREPGIGVNRATGRPRFVIVTISPAAAAATTADAFCFRALIPTVLELCFMVVHRNVSTEPSICRRAFSTRSRLTKRKPAWLPRNGWDGCGTRDRTAPAAQHPGPVRASPGKCKLSRRPCQEGSGKFA